jgi:ketosteroid isomerase-like protein
MSGEHVDVVERWYEAYNARDLEQLLELMHEDVDLTSAGMSGVEGSSHVGHGGMRRYFADLWETWEDPRVDVEHLLDRGGLVVMLGSTTGKGRRSGMVVPQVVATVVRVEDGRIRHYRTYRDWSEALDAAGPVDSSPGDGRDATGRAARRG